jgi:hypothetical protein
MHASSGRGGGPIHAQPSPPLPLRPPPLFPSSPSPPPPFPLPAPWCPPGWRFVGCACKRSARAHLRSCQARRAHLNTQTKLLWQCSRCPWSLHPLRSFGSREPNLSHQQLKPCLWVSCCGAPAGAGHKEEEEDVIQTGAGEMVCVTL